MSRYLFLIFYCILHSLQLSAQQVIDTAVHPVTDSITHKDSLVKTTGIPAVQTKDSISKRPVKEAEWQPNLSIPFSSQYPVKLIMQGHPYFGFSNQVIFSGSSVKKFYGKELIFYLLVLLLLIYAFLRRTFPKYFNDLFRLFFRNTLKQRQIREQLMQTPLPSLLLNGFFVVSGALYLSFIMEEFYPSPQYNFWLLFLYFTLGLSLLYGIKFLGLKLSGWLFSMQEAATSYIFIVFITNKMMGLLLLPFLVMLAFTAGNIYMTCITLSWCVIGALLVYRFILTYAAVRNQVKVNPFHFFLWLCAFEIAPLLLIYKGLLLFFRITA